MSEVEVVDESDDESDVGDVAYVVPPLLDVSSSESEDEEIIRGHGTWNYPHRSPGGAYHLVKTHMVKTHLVKTHLVKSHS